MLQDALAALDPSEPKAEIPAVSMPADTRMVFSLTVSSDVGGDSATVEATVMKSAGAVVGVQLDGGTSLRQVTKAEKLKPMELELRKLEVGVGVRSGKAILILPTQTVTAHSRPMLARRTSPRALWPTLRA